MLYNGRYNERHDFIALELMDGRLQFSFSMGANSSHVVLQQPHSLADGNWHTVTVDYVNRVKTSANQIVGPSVVALTRAALSYISFRRRC